MAFSWTEDIGKGTAVITKAAVEEIRGNLDQIKDNEACVADKGTYMGAQETAVDTGYDGTHYNDQHSAYDNDVNTGVNSGYNSTYYVNQHGTYKSGVDIGVDGAYDSGVKSAYYVGDNSAAYVTDESSNYGTHYWDHHLAD